MANAAPFQSLANFRRVLPLQILVKELPVGVLVVTPRATKELQADQPATFSRVVVWQHR